MIRQAQKIFAGLAAGLVVMAGAVPAIAQVDGIKQIIIAVGDRAETAGQDTPGAQVANSQVINVTVRSSAEHMIKTVRVGIHHRGRGCPEDLRHQYDTHRYDTGVGGTSVAGRQVDVSENWDTKQITPLNGQYDVFVVVEGSKAGGLGVNDASKCLSGIQVNNRPQDPSGVRAAMEGGKPVIRWSPNPEGDITSYKVSRSVGDGPFQEPKSTGPAATSFTDEDEIPSKLPYDTPIRYRVTAFRASPVTGEIGSDPVSTAELIIPAPPPPSPSPSSTPGEITATPKRDAPNDLSQKLGSNPSGSGKTVKPVSLAAPNTISGPRRDGGSGFGRLLPFGQDAPGTFLDEEFAEAVGDAIRNPGRLISQEIQVNPLRFFAAAALLLVTAGHLGRGAHTLFLSAKTATQPSSPAIPA